MAADRPKVERVDCTVYVDGAPTLLLNAPIATRPQDWSPAARAILFGEEQRLRQRVE